MFSCPISPPVEHRHISQLSQKYANLDHMWDYCILLPMYPVVRKVPKHAGRCSTEQSALGYSGIYDL